MPFLVPALAPIVAEAVGLGSLGLIGQGIVGVGLSFGVSYLSKQLQPKSTTSATATRGMQLSLSYQPNGARQIPIGLKTASAGTFTYHNVFGPNGNDYVELVYRLGDLPCGSLIGGYADGKPLTLGDFDDTGTVTGFTVAEYPGAMWVRFFNGDWSQSADPDLVAHATGTGYSSNNRGRGICYVRVTMKYNAKLFKNGLPAFLWVFQGAKLYDWRQDSSVGGSGSQRWGVESTYTVTGNPMVISYNWYRGITVNGKPLAGMNVPADFLPYDAWTAAANACDEDVSLKVGGSEKRYRAAGIISSDADNVTVIRDLMTSCAALVADASGIFKPYTGVSQSPVIDITDADFLALDAITYVPKKSRASLVNSVFGSFNDPSQMYQSAALPPRISPDDIDADGGVQLSQNYSLTYVPSQTQGQRVLEILRRQERHQRNIKGKLRPRCLRLEAGDWISWTSARYGFVAMLFRVVQVSVDRDGTVDVELAETSDTVFSWIPATDELDPHNPHSVGSGGEKLQTVTGLHVRAIVVQGDGQEQLPGIEITYDPVTDATVTGLMVEFRRVGDNLAIQRQILTPGDGEYAWVEGVQGGLRYEVRVNLITTPSRSTIFTAWTPMALDSVTEPHVVSVATTVPDGAITPPKLSGQALLELQMGTALASLQGSVNARIDTAMSSVRAAISSLGESMAKNTTLIRAVRAQSDGNSLGVTEVLEALNGVSGLGAQWSVSIDNNGNVTGLVTLSGDQQYTQFSVLADRIVFALPDGTGAKQVFTVGTLPDGSKGVGIDASQVIFNGSIKAKHIDTVSLGTISITDPNNTSTLNLATMSWRSTDGKRVFDMKNGILDWAF